MGGILLPAGGTVSLNVDLNQERTDMKTKKTAERLTSMELAIRYGVSMSLLNQWRRFEGFLPTHPSGSGHP